jgi:M6 family metalloprotease-like protein
LTSDAGNQRTLQDCSKGYHFVSTGQQCLPDIVRLLPLRLLTLSTATKPSHVLLDKRDDTYVQTSPSEPTTLRANLGKDYIVTHVRLNYYSTLRRAIPVSVFDEAGKKVGNGVFKPRHGGQLVINLRQSSGEVPTGSQFRIVIPKAAGVKVKDVALWGGSTMAEASDKTIVWGLAVVVDFANSILEDYTRDETAINNVGELRKDLDLMESHWRWMSKDKHETEWAIERITLSQDFEPNAFGNQWQTFRDELASKLSAKVKIGDYDSNLDGKLDVAWFVLSSKEIDNGETGYWFMIGGMSGHKNVDMFVDGQGFFSTRVSCVGCWNHELAHTSVIGLPDLYGSHSNLGMTSLMSHPWAENSYPGGFLAYELRKLGWMTDYVVFSASRGGAGLCLSPMEDGEYRAALIETGDPNEFFMLEYHKRPESSWGSGWNMDADGILITHIVPTGSNYDGPTPLIRIESADGDLPYGVFPTETDFWYPENPGMPENKFVGKLYDGRELFAVENFFRETTSKICFDVVFF